MPLRPAEIPAQAKKYVRFGGDAESKKENSIIDANSGHYSATQQPINKSEPSRTAQSDIYPVGLVRIREEVTHSTNVSSPTTSSAPTTPTAFSQNMATYTTESLHSFSFSSSKGSVVVEMQRGILERSLDFVKNQLRGWRIPRIMEVDGGADYISQFPLGGGGIGWPSWSTAPNSPRTSGEFERDKDILMSDGTDRIGSFTDSDNIILKQKSSLKRALTVIPQFLPNDLLQSRLSLSPVDCLAEGELLHYTTSPNSYFFNSNLHPPTRILPQTQAMLTLDADWHILLVNNISCLLFGYDREELLNMNVLLLLDQDQRQRWENVLATRKHELQSAEEDAAEIRARESKDAKGFVLVCGKVIPIVKKDGTRSAASLWLKEKHDSETGKPIYIWIMEQIDESLMILSISKHGLIQGISGHNDMFGYGQEEIVGKNVEILVPALGKHRHDSGYMEQKPLSTEEVNRDKYYGARTKSGVSFPVIVKVQRPTNTASPGLTLKIISIPTIAGLLTVHANDGRIQSCNAVFAKYLFGISNMPEVIERKGKIDQLLPQFSNMIDRLKREEEFDGGRIVGNMGCRKASLDINGAGSPRTNEEMGEAEKTREPLKNDWTPTRQHSGIVAVHRDGTQLSVELQVRIIKAGREKMYALWITFDRSAVFTKANGRTAGEAIKPTTPTTRTRALKTTTKPLEDPKPTVSAWGTSEIAASLSAYDDNTTYRFPPPSSASRDSSAFEVQPVTSEAAATVGSPSPLSPGPIPVKANPNSSLELPRPPPHGAGLPSNVIPVTPPAATTPPVALRNYSALTRSKMIEDFVIVNSLGQGAYGLVKMAYHRNDPDQVKRVLKYVVKQRILVDCWTRDRHLGVVPLEIHILHTLRGIPHPNVLSMIDYFEDEEHYYIEMNLHGAGMDLFDYIELNQNISEVEIRSIFRQVCWAVQHLHHNKIVHRDIKDENVILDEQGCVQLIDFGSATYLREGKRYETFCGTLDYAAPEILSGKNYAGPPQDIYALGILLYTLIYKENPFYSIDEIMSGALRVPFVLSESNIDLIRWMLNRDVDKRPTIDEVIEHEFVRQA